MPRGKHLWDAAGLVSMPLIAMAFLYANFLEEYVLEWLPPSVLGPSEVYPTIFMGKHHKPVMLTPGIQLVLGLAACGVALAVYRVARSLERRDWEQAGRKRPTLWPRTGTDADRSQILPEKREPASPAPVNQVASRPPSEVPCAPTMACRIAELLASLSWRGKQLTTDTWSAEIGRFRGYPLRFIVRADGEYLWFQVQSPLMPEQRWDPNVLAGALLEAHAGMHYGSFRFVESVTGQLVALGQICDTRYVPPPLLREIAWRLAEQFRDMICKLYALDLIEDGWCDGEWGTPC